MFRTASMTGVVYSGPKGMARITPCSIALNTSTSASNCAIRACSSTFNSVEGEHQAYRTEAA